MSSRPSPSDVRVVLPDIHGNHAALRDLLTAAGVLDDRGRRRDGFFIWQIGDLIHGGHNVLDADLETLNLAHDWIDVVLLGNHELPFVTPINSPWAGMHRNRNGRAAHPVAQAELNRLFRDGFFHAAADADGWLLTHAGVNAKHLFDVYDQPADAELAYHLNNAADAAAYIQQRFDERVQMRDEDRDWLIDGRCPWRGGSDRTGSIFWTDLHALLESARRYGNPIAQIVGHTPRIAQQPALFDVAMSDLSKYTAPGKLGYEPIWAIDLYGIDDGRIACLVHDPADPPDDGHWTAVAIDRPMRPGSDPDHPQLTDLENAWPVSGDWSTPWGGFQRR